MGKRKVKKQSKKAAKKEVRKLLGREGAKHPQLASPQNAKEQMMSQNPYLCSLMDPYNCGPGTKIPGFGNMPTATLSVWDRRTLTVNAQGVVGLFLQGLMPGLQDGGGVGVPYSSGWTLGTAATTNNLFQSWSTVTVGGQNVLLGNTQTGVTVDATYQDLRVVSAATCIQYTGTTLNDQGIFVGASYPRETGGFSWPGTTNLSLADFRNSVYAKETAVNLHKGLTVIYKPSDATSYDFRRTGSRGYPLNAIIGATNTFWSDGYGSLAVVGAGLTAGTTVNIITVINYEAHPEPASTTIINVSPSHQDPLSLAHAENSIQGVSAVTEGTKSVPSNPSLNQVATVSTADKKPTFLDKALSVVSQIPKYAGTAMQIAESASPLLALL